MRKTPKKSNVWVNSRSKDFGLGQTSCEIQMFTGLWRSTSPSLLPQQQRRLVQHSSTIFVLFRCFVGYLEVVLKSSFQVASFHGSYFKVFLQIMFSLSHTLAHGRDGLPRPIWEWPTCGTGSGASDDMCLRFSTGFCKLPIHLKFKVLPFLGTENILCLFGLVKKSVKTNPYTKLEA